VPASAEDTFFGSCLNSRIFLNFLMIIFREFFFEFLLQPYMKEAKKIMYIKKEITKNKMGDKKRKRIQRRQKASKHLP
jgi:hypothetical protein